MINTKKMLFSKALDDFIVGSVCECAHLKSDHGSKSTSESDGVIFREEEGGSCCKKGCSCSKFTWYRFITLKETLEFKKTKVA